MRIRVGLPGPKGEVGSSGIKGERGSGGKQGHNGQKGDKGNVSPVGPKGDSERKRQDPGGMKPKEKNTPKTICFRLEKDQNITRLTARFPTEVKDKVIFYNSECKQKTSVLGAVVFFRGNRNPLLLLCDDGDGNKQRNNSDRDVPCQCPTGQRRSTGSIDSTNKTSVGDQLMCVDYSQENLETFIHQLIPFDEEDASNRFHSVGELLILCRFYGQKNLIDFIRPLIDEGIDVNAKDGTLFITSLVTTAARI